MYWCEGCCDEHEESELQCRLCGAKLEPKYDWKEDTVQLPGLTHGSAAVTRGQETKTYVLLPDDLESVQWPIPDEWVAQIERADTMIEWSFGKTFP